MAKARLRRYEESIVDYSEAIRLDADSVLAWFNRGTAKACLGKYEKAIADYDEAIRLDASLAVAWLCRGKAKMKLEYYGEARSDMGKALALFQGRGDLVRQERVKKYIAKLDAEDDEPSDSE